MYQLYIQYFYSTLRRSCPDCSLTALLFVSLNGTILFSYFPSHTDILLWMAAGCSFCIAHSDSQARFLFKCCFISYYTFKEYTKQTDVHFGEQVMEQQSRQVIVNLVRKGLIVSVSAILQLPLFYDFVGSPDKNCLHIFPYIKAGISGTVHRIFM